MVTKAQLRILAWLDRHPDSIVNAWDVPRDISLPGIAEGLGVVRSALNLPLSGLEESGLLTKRMAHVIGGGSRRRQVYHITTEGRLQLANTTGDFEKAPARQEIIGNPPIIENIFGRSDEREKCLELLQNSSLMVTGMPGIGKSAFVVSLCQELASQYTIRWANANAFSDYQSIIKSWFGDEIIPRDIKSFTMAVSQSKTVLVIDDINQVNERHKKGVIALVETLCLESNIRLILISRESTLTYSGELKFKLDALDLASCCMMLGQETELSVREQIATSLGNHPLALKLYQPEYNIPESSNDVIDYVENVVLKPLSPQQKEQITNLSLEPGLVDADHSVIADAAKFLDEQNLLLWGGDLLQIQHLIRNVVRNKLTDEQRQSGHEFLANHWRSKTSPNASENYLYHLANSNLVAFVEYMSNNLDSLEQFNSTAIAAIVNSSIEQNEHSEELIYLECKIAAYRLEPDIIRENLIYLRDKHSIEMEFVLAKIEARIEDCDALLDEVLKNCTPLEGVRTLISLANQCLEDRLPGERISQANLDRVENYLSQISLADLQEGRQSVIVAISLIRFSIALNRQDYSATSEILQSLTTIGSIDDSVIVHLQAKIELERYHNGLISLDEVSDIVDSHCELIRHRLVAESIRLRFVESLVFNNEAVAKSQFETLKKPELFARSNTSIRYSARWWLLHSQIYPNQNVASLSESLVQFRNAGCSSVATKLERKLHAQI